MPDCPVPAPAPKRRRTGSALRPPALRSAVTNGTRLFADGAHEGSWARRFRDLVQLHAEDIGPAETLSEGQRSLCRRCATLEIELERMEGALSKGEDVDLELYRSLTGTLGRVVRLLGLKRTARDVTPSIADLIAGHSQ